MNRGDLQYRAIAAAIKRLKASNTPLKRANALKAFAKAVKELEASVAACFPRLRADGTAIVRRKRRGGRCPICKRPFRTFYLLARHLSDAHDVRSGDCVCGKRFRTHGRLARHLVAMPDLRIHFAEAALKNASGVE